jgi:hypothetical protein
MKGLRRQHGLYHRVQKRSHTMRTQPSFYIVLSLDVLIAFVRRKGAICLLLTACWLTQFSEIPNVLISRSMPIGLAKKRHNLVAVF